MVIETLFLAVALMLVIEGLMPLLAPRRWRALFRQVTALTDGQLRFLGLAAVTTGFLLMLPLLLG